MPPSRDLVKIDKPIDTKNEGGQKKNQDIKDLMQKLISKHLDKMDSKIEKL